MILLWLALMPFLVILYLEIKNFRMRKAIDSNFPGAPKLPVIGNAHQVGKTPSEVINQLFSWWNEFGKRNFRVWIGYYPNVIVTDPKTLEFILNSNTLTHKSDVYDMLHPWLGEGLLTSFGTKWHKHRKMITPSFHFKILQDFHEVMNENSTKFIEKLREKSSGETIFDFQESAHYLTLDVICETAMGVHINAMDLHDSDIVRAFKDMCYNINMRAFHPIKRNTKYYRFFPDYTEYEKTLKILQDFTYDVIKKRIKAREENQSTEVNKDNSTDGFSKRKMAFLDTLLTSTIDNRPLTLQEIYEEVSTFMFEGHDTTTSGVSFAVYLLSRHPEIQAKVYAEQKDIMGSDMKQSATFQQISEMKYLDMFVKEAQRLYPSVPFIGREAEKDYEINGQFFPKGTELNLFIMSLGYNEKIFKDPYVVRPERFETEKPGPFEYVPFSAGPRNCIGQKFALLEIKTAVSKIVREFEVLPPLDQLAAKNSEVQHYMGLSKEEQMKIRPNPHKYDPILSAVLTLKSENGIMLRLRERK